MPGHYRGERGGEEHAAQDSLARPLSVRRLRHPFARTRRVRTAPSGWRDHRRGPRGRRAPRPPRVLASGGGDAGWLRGLPRFYELTDLPVEFEWSAGAIRPGE